MESVYTLIDQLRPQGAPHARLITMLGDRPCHTFEKGLESTVRWFLNNLGWCQAVQRSSQPRA